MKNHGGRATLALVVLFAALPTSLALGQAVETPAPTSDEEGFAAMQRRVERIRARLLRPPSF